jgi:hypothetical protein
MDAARAGGYDMRSRVGLPDKIAALFANLRVQALPDVTCSKLTVTAVVEGGDTICAGCKCRLAIQ